MSLETPSFPLFLISAQYTPPRVHDIKNMSPAVQKSPEITSPNRPVPAIWNAFISLVQSKLSKFKIKSNPQLSLTLNLTL